MDVDAETVGQAWSVWAVLGLVAAGGSWWVWSRLALLRARVDHLESSLATADDLADRAGHMAKSVAELETADQRRSEARTLVEPKPDARGSGPVDPAPAPPYETFP